MARTVAEVITSAVGTMNDVDRVRYPEPEQIGFVVDALQMMRNVRPDLFIGAFATPIGTLTSASTLPIDDQFFRPVVDYVIARCESKDAEHVESGRVALMAAMSQGFLL
jgi:hypothetical protein